MIRRGLSIAVSILLLTMLLSGGVVAVSTGGAGDVSSGSSEDVEDDQEDEDSSDDDEESTVVAQVDDRLRVTGYSYDEANETMSVSLANRGDSSSAVTITEAISTSSSGSGSFGIEQVTVYSGEQTTVEIDVDSQNAGVMITTEMSVSNGEGTYLQADNGIQLIDGAASWRDVQIGGLAGIVSTMLMTIVVAWHVVARQSIDYEEADLSA